jgi:D-beta-D-heptose 7-phosphate kinase/D-beta-D-heptose 1-phosphate adenosyltransferase
MPNSLLHNLASWKPFSAVVLGDFMLDQLVYGNADRLSPEAPVPVLHVQREENRPGGAANVCLDLKAMHGTVRAVGVVGIDAAGGELRRLLSESGVDPAGLVADAARPTTRKRSLIGLAQHRHPQKMFREDHESRAPLSDAAARAVLDALDRALVGADALCIEDYAKGVCSPEVCSAAILRARRAGVPVFVDPAAIKDYSRYRGATVITPNRTEAALALDLRPLDDAEPIAHAPIAERLLRALDLEACVITLDRHGALLLARDVAAEHTGADSAVVLPTQARQVYDVTGAGDMVLAALAAGRANGMTWTDAVRFANAAAGLEVEQFGVVPIPLERIHAEIMTRGRNRVRTRDELLVEVRAHKRDGRSVVFANGCFDILHAGHLAMLRRAAGLGDFLVVAVNTDASVRRLNKGPDRPINNEIDRAEMLGGLDCVGAVVLFDEDTPEALIRAVEPDVLVKGAEYRVDQIPGAQFVLSRGGRVELIEMVKGRSTTGLVERIRATEARA